ncbi:MAG: hypothetical protein JWP87_2505 [Labilithrix sp.]|jgi:hypothetical protein|nr:hypothetical protein [Labilithrix sp.]
MKQVQSNIVVGKKDVDLTAPSHVRGVHEGNWPTHLGRRNRRSFEPENIPISRSTGINPDARAPIDPAMPHLSPP